MAGKKKKKPSANPARGFATVSQPSKAKEIAQHDDETPSQNKQPSADGLANGDNSVEQPKLGNNNDEVKPIEKMTPEELEAHLENAELRNLAEQNASRIKSEAVRQASRLKNERRQLRQQADQASVYGLDDVMVDKILQNSTQTEFKPLTTSRTSNLAQIEESELLQKLWLLQEILHNLKVHMLDEVLTHVLYICHHLGVESGPNSVWGLEEALAWIAGFGDADNNIPYDSDQTNGADESDDALVVNDADDSKYYYGSRTV